MKTLGIPPEDVAAHALTSGNDRDRQLALLYTRYQTFLRNADCADGDGLLWLAAEALESSPHLFAGAGHLLLLGFDQFSPVQLRILRALASRLPHLSIYLLWDAARHSPSITALTGQWFGETA
jgi:superfamily I DNA/RNA helicase